MIPDSVSSEPSASGEKPEAADEDFTLEDALRALAEEEAEIRAAMRRRMQP